MIYEENDLLNKYYESHSELNKRLDEGYRHSIDAINRIKQYRTIELLYVPTSSYKISDVDDINFWYFIVHLISFEYARKNVSFKFFSLKASISNVLETKNLILNGESTIHFVFDYLINYPDNHNYRYEDVKKMVDSENYALYLIIGFINQKRKGKPIIYKGELITWMQQEHCFFWHDFMDFLEPLKTDNEEESGKINAASNYVFGFGKEISEMLSSLKFR